jgi:tRNA(fMet)-specific endonuclease VapC
VRLAELRSRRWTSGDEDSD